MKIGFLIEDVFIPAWLYVAIDKALKLNQINACVLILTNTTQSQKNKKYNFLFKSNHFLYNYYTKWDKNRHIHSENDAFALNDIRDLMPHVPIIKIGLELTPEDLKAIKAFKPDVLLEVGLSPLKGNLYQLPTYGLWSYQLSDPTKHRYGPPGFWETYFDEATIVGALTRTTIETGEAEVLAQVVLPTNEINSPSMNANTLAWDLFPLFSLCLKQIQKTGKPFLKDGKPLITKHYQNHRPNFIYTLLMLSKLIYRKIKHPSGYISQHWSIHYSYNLRHLKTASFDIKEFKVLDNPKGTFWADPFLLHVLNKDYLFFEEYIYSKRKGILKAVEINQQGLVGEPVTILEEPYHLSQPFVFIEEGDLYLLPEKAESGEITLYRCLDFPNKWEKAATLLKGGYYVDPILFKKDDKWWLFFVEKMSPHGTPSLYGKLWFSEDLLGPWKEHPMSPISTDCHYSRNAGIIFKQNNQFIRAVQDCSNDYGYQIHFLKINELSETNYKEELIGSISPEELGVEGVHTINFCGHLTVIDTRQKTLKQFIFDGLTYD